jgi:predicted HTH transcriptional regulator
VTASIIHGLQNLSQWDEDYIASLPVGEFDWLEYKASEKLNDPGWSQDMSKYVSAWVNYDSGYVIFGVRDPKPGIRWQSTEVFRRHLSQSCLTGLTMLSPSLLIRRSRSYQPG